MACRVPVWKSWILAVDIGMLETVILKQLEGRQHLHWRKQVFLDVFHLVV
jgi:hypothetical protein